MTRYSIEPKGRILVKGYRFLYFAKNISKNIDKNVRQNLSDKYSHKFLDHTTRSAAYAVKET